MIENCLRYITLVVNTIIIGIGLFLIGVAIYLRVIIENPQEISLLPFVLGVLVVVYSLFGLYGVCVINNGLWHLYQCCVLLVFLSACCALFITEHDFLRQALDSSLRLNVHFLSNSTYMCNVHLTLSTVFDSCCGYMEHMGNSPCCKNNTSATSGGCKKHVDTLLVKLVNGDLLFVRASHVLQVLLVLVLVTLVALMRRQESLSTRLLWKRRSPLLRNWLSPRAAARFPVAATKFDRYPNARPMPVRPSSMLRRTGSSTASSSSSSYEAKQLLLRNNTNNNNNNNNYHLIE